MDYQVTDQPLGKDELEEIERLKGARHEILGGLNVGM